MSGALGTARKGVARRRGQGHPCAAPRPRRWTDALDQLPDQERAV